MDKKEIIKLLKEQIKLIKKEYNTHPTKSNEGDCMNARDGFDLLILNLELSIPIKKVKVPKKVKHILVGDVTIDGEDKDWFEKEPIEFIEEYDLDMPSFSFDKGDSPEAEEGETLYVKVNGELYSFTIHEGECVEASWSGSIYRTDIKNVKLIPKAKVGNYNLVKYNRY